MTKRQGPFLGVEPPPGPTPDELYIESIGKMDMAQLLAEVLGMPEYMTDSYYRDFCTAIQKRGAELLPNPLPADVRPVVVGDGW